MREKRRIKERVGISDKGITLIALVITIIVLLILAGISISMLSGDNGILQQTTNARTKTIHANVLEQMQLETSTYTVDKATGVYANSLIDYLKSKSIISDISGEEDKWLINVTTLLDSNQSMGKGTYPNDVYVLEKQSTSTGSIINTKIAALTPIRISATNSEENIYIVKYYGNVTSENLTLGSLIDDYDSKNNNLIQFVVVYDDEGEETRVVCYAENTMTWRDWIGSEYDIGLKESFATMGGDRVMSSRFDLYLNGSIVMKNDIIQSAEYNAVLGVR